MRKGTPSEKLNTTNVPFTSMVDSVEPEIPHFSDLAEYLCTQKGSRMMQDFIKKAPISVINLIIAKINDDFGKLMSDSYGNYFCQTIVRMVGS